MSEGRSGVLVEEISCTQPEDVGSTPRWAVLSVSAVSRTLSGRQEKRLIFAP